MIAHESIGHPQRFMPRDVNGLRGGSRSFSLCVRWVEPIFGQGLPDNPFVNTPARADGVNIHSGKGNQTRRERGAISEGNTRKGEPRKC